MADESWDVLDEIDYVNPADDDWPILVDRGGFVVEIGTPILHAYFVQQAFEMDEDWSKYWGAVDADAWERLVLEGLDHFWFAVAMASEDNLFWPEGGGQSRKCGPNLRITMFEKYLQWIPQFESLQNRFYSELFGSEKHGYCWPNCAEGYDASFWQIALLDAAKSLFPQQFADCNRNDLQSLSFLVRSSAVNDKTMKGRRRRFEQSFPGIPYKPISCFELLIERRVIERVGGQFKIVCTTN